MIDLYIVDHHETERLGMNRVLESASDIRVLGEAGSTEDTMERISSMDIDVVLADIRMDTMNGMEFTRRLKEKNPRVAVLIVTSDADLDRNVEMVRQCGADGFLSKARVPDELANSIRKVAKGKPFVDER